MLPLYSRLKPHLPNTHGRQSDFRHNVFRRNDWVPKYESFSAEILKTLSQYLNNS